MPAVIEKPSFEDISAKKGKKVSKEYGGSGSESSGPSPGEDSRSKKPGGKRSFLQKAKRFGKQGRHGKGTKLDGEMYSYYVRILELLRKDEFEADEDRDILIENSLKLAEEQEVSLSSNQLVSRVIENMLPLASEDRIHSFCQGFTPNLRVAVVDPFASHVLEKLLELTSSDKWRSCEKLTSWFEKTSMFVLNNFEDFTFDKYGSFVTKKVLECLSGHVESSNEPDIAGTKGSKSSILRLELQGTRTRNPKWEKTLQDFARRFAAWPQFNDLGQKPETSRLLQNVIQTVSRTEKSEEVVKEILLRVLATLPDTLEPDNALHRILEVALPVADQKMYSTMFDKFYKGKLSQYIHGPCFTLQKVISSAPSEKHFVSIFDELTPQIKTVFLDGRTVIIHNLAAQCIKYGARHQELWKLLINAFKTMKNDSSKEKANLLMTLVTIKPKTEKTEANLGSQKFSTTYYGSSTVQALMDFNAPVASKVLECFDELKTPEVMKLALDPKGSFIISKIFKSWVVPEGHKEKLLHKLKDSLFELATTKFGSRIIDLIWVWADVSQKTTVATVLSQRIPALSANKYGRFLVETMGLQALIRNKKEWTEHIAAQDKRKKDADKIATELGLSSGNITVDPSNEEPKSAKKAKKRKSEAAQESVITEPETPKSPKSKRKDRKSENVITEPMELDSRSEEANEIDETPKKSKKNKKHRKSQAESQGVINTEMKMELEDSILEQSETPKKKKKSKKSESPATGDMTPKLAEVDDTPKKKKKNRKSEKNDSEPEVSKISEIENDTTPKKKKNRKSEKNDLELEVATIPEIENDATPKKKKKKDRESKKF